MGLLSVLDAAAWCHAMAPLRRAWSRRLSAVQYAVTAADDGPRVAFHVPCHAQSRRELVEIALGEARWQAWIAGEQKAFRSVGDDLRLNSHQVD